MTNEVLIGRLYDIIDEVTRLGGEQERTSIVPGILVADASPNDLPAGYIKIVNPRDGTYVPCLTVNGLVVSDNDLVNVLFTKGTEPIALSQSAGSPSSSIKVSELWDSNFGAVAWQTGASGDLANVDGETLTLNDSTPTARIILDPGTPSTEAFWEVRDQGGALKLRLSTDNLYRFLVSNGGLDVSQNVFRVDVTGNPQLEWDETGDRFQWNKGHLVTAGDLQVSTGHTVSEVNGFIVKNTSGATASAADAGYLDENNEYKTTTTAEDGRPNPVAVLVGGINNSDIYVTGGPGRATLNYAGSAPSSGDFLTFSTTAGKVQARSAMHPAILAQARAAGSGGTVEVELLLRRKPFDVSPADVLFRVDNANLSDFVATIDSLPGGAVVRYDTPSSGSETCIKPQAATVIGKIRLHNTTRGDYALIDSVNTTGGAGYDGEITLTAAVPGTWVAGDTITARSQNGNTTPQGTAYWFDVEIPDAVEIPELATKLKVQFRWQDTGGATSMASHPYKADNPPDQYFTRTQNTEPIFQYGEIALIDRTINVVWQATGAATARPRIRCIGVEVAI